jgi:TolA-binding protein
MLWLGLRGRAAIASLNERLALLDQRLDELQKAFDTLDLEMTDKVDRLNGIAKRIQGRRGGRPPSEQNGDAESENAPTQLGFTRHVL